MIVIQGKELYFDNYCWHEYVKRVDWENLSGSSNQAATYAALASAAYTNGEEKPEWKAAGEFYRSMNDDEKRRLKEAFEGMQEYKAFLGVIEKEAEKLNPKDAKKKPLKASRKT